MRPLLASTRRAEAGNSHCINCLDEADQNHAQKILTQRGALAMQTQKRAALITFRCPISEASRVRSHSLAVGSHEPALM